MKFSHGRFRQSSVCQQVAKQNTPFCDLTGMNSSIFLGVSGGSGGYDGPHNPLFFRDRGCAG